MKGRRSGEPDRLRNAGVQVHNPCSSRKGIRRQPVFRLWRSLPGPGQTQLRHAPFERGGFETQTLRSPPPAAYAPAGRFERGADMLELQVALESLFTRFPDLRPAFAEHAVPWKVGSSVWGLAELPVTF